MSATVHTLPTRVAVDDAWERYAALTREAIADPRRFLDREFMQSQARARADFEELYLATEARR